MGHYFLDTQYNPVHKLSKTSLIYDMYKIILIGTKNRLTVLKTVEIQQCFFNPGYPSGHLLCCVNFYTDLSNFFCQNTVCLGSSDPT